MSVAPSPSVPRPDVDERRDNAAFAALMRALARPGGVETLPEPGLASIALALVDVECRVFADDPALGDLVARAGARRVAQPGAADHLFLSLAGRDGVDHASAAPTGDALYPDLGATLVAPARIGSGQRLRLTGPGIETVAEIELGDIHPAFWPLRARRCAYPEGWELFLVDGARVLGLPRSTTVEAL